jgi:hypothetical protein
MPEPSVVRKDCGREGSALGAFSDGNNDALTALAAK